MGNVPPALAVTIMTPLHCSGGWPSLPLPGLAGRLGGVSGLPVSMERAASRTPSSTCGGGEGGLMNTLTGASTALQAQFHLNSCQRGGALLCLLTALRSTSSVCCQRSLLPLIRSPRSAMPRRGGMGEEPEVYGCATCKSVQQQPAQAALHLTLPLACVEQGIVEPAPALHVRLEGCQVLRWVCHIAAHGDGLPSRRADASSSGLCPSQVDIRQCDAHASSCQLRSQVGTDSGGAASDEGCLALHAAPLQQQAGREL